MAVCYGKRFPEGWSRLHSDNARWQYPGHGLVRLAVSDDGTGESWQSATIGERMGSCYPTIIEVEPGVLFCQVDGWCWRCTWTAATQSTSTLNGERICIEATPSGTVASPSPTCSSWTIVETDLYLNPAG